VSIQSVIDFNYKTEKGRYLHSFTVIGEKGDAVVPKDVHVRFYSCIIGNLILQGNNNIFIEGGKCESIVGSDSLLMSRGTGFGSGNVALTGSKADLYNITSTSKWQLKARSYLRADNSIFSASDIGCDFSSGSQGRITRCSYSAHGTAAIKADGASFVLLSKCPSIKGVKALWALDRSVIQAIECAVIEGVATYAAHAENYARIEGLNCALIQGQIQAIFGDTHGFVLCNKCDQIIGNSDSAIFLDNHAGAEVRTFKIIRGQGNSAIRGANLNSIFMLGGQLIKSDAKDAIQLENGGHGHVVSVQSLIGTGRHGIHLDETSELYVNDVITIEGMGLDGVYAANKSLLQLYEVAKVNGLAGSGAKIIEGSRLATFFVENITGEGGDGVTLGDDSYASLQGAAAVTGMAGDGVKMGAAARLILSQCQAVTGMAGDGVNAGSDCQITASKGTAITGQAGDGIVAGAGSTVNVVGQDSISGLAGDGIKATESLIKLRKVQSISGLAGDGLNLTQTDVDAVLCPVISGVVNGVSSAGAGVKQTRLRFDRCAIIGAAVGLDVQDTFVVSRGTTYSGPSAMIATMSHIRSVADIFGGDVTVTDTIYEEWNSVVSGVFTQSSGATVGALGVMASSFISGGVVVSAGISLGALALAAGYLGLFGGSATVAGAGAVLSIGAGEPVPGVTYVEVTLSSIKIRDMWGDVMVFDGSAISITAITSLSEYAATMLLDVSGTLTEQSAAMAISVAGTLSGTASLYNWN